MGMTQDTLIAAVIAAEVAEDDYAADQFRQSRMRKGSRPSAWGPIMTAKFYGEMVEAWDIVALEAEAAGLDLADVDLFMPVL